MLRDHTTPACFDQVDNQTNCRGLAWQPGSLAASRVEAPSLGYAGMTGVQERRRQSRKVGDKHKAQGRLRLSGRNNIGRWIPRSMDSEANKWLDPLALCSRGAPDFSHSYQHHQGASNSSPRCIILLVFRALVHKLTMYRLRHGWLI